MQGLFSLYRHTGRRAEWAALVAAVTPELVGPDGGPLPGREWLWSLVTHYRVGLAREALDWVTAERLQRRNVDWQHQQTASLLERPVAGLNGAERNRLRSLAASLHELGEIQRSLEQPACVQSYQESLELSEKIGENTGAAICAFNLGGTYLYLASVRNLEKAGLWSQRSLELCQEDDHVGQSRCLSNLGAVAWERFKEARAAVQLSEAEVQVKAALLQYHQALSLLPADAVNDLANTHDALGDIYGTIGQLETALQHNQKCISIRDESGNHYGAAQTRYNVAVDLFNAGRLPDALAYARAALRGFQHYGERAQQEIDKTQALIYRIEQAGNGVQR